MDALVVMAREPVAGEVKSRLARDIGDGPAATLYRAFILDTLRLCDRLAGTARYLAGTPDGAGAAFGALTGPDWRVLPQGEGDLGDRLRRVFARLFDEGHGRVVVVGSDSPTLPPALVSRALEALRERDVALGPCLDGGYYLLGLAAPVDGLFEDIPWGTPDVFARTLEGVRESGRSLALLPPWYDVDTIAELRMMKAHLDGLRVSGEEILAEHTLSLVENAVPA